MVFFSITTADRTADKCRNIKFLRLLPHLSLHTAWWQHDCMYLQNVWSGHVGSNPNEWKGEHCWCDACTLGREKGQSNMPEEGESLRTLIRKA